LAAHVDVFPELVAQHADPSHRVLQPRGVPRHPALVPHHATELAVEGVDRLPTARAKEATDPLVHLTLNLAECRMLGVDLGGLRLGAVDADRVWQDEVAVGESLHQPARSQPVALVVGRVGLAGTPCPGARGSRSSGTAARDSSPAPPREFGRAVGYRPSASVPRCARRCGATRSSMSAWTGVVRSPGCRWGGSG